MNTNLVAVYAHRGQRRHLVDANKYKRVSKSTSLCGKTGKDYWIPNAIYYIGMTWPMCKKCEKEAKKFE